MGKKKKRKKLLFGSISITSAVALIVMVVGPSIVIDSEKPVKNQQEKKLWDIIVPNDYVTIQEAVENAVPGDRIFVKSGVYKSPVRFLFRPIKIDKPELTICGENKSTTIISGRGLGTPIYISANSVNITGFTIKNNGLNDSLIQVNSDKCIISNNIFKVKDIFDGIEYGIVFYDAHENTFFENIITGADKGLEIGGCNHNNFFNNTFEDNDIAIDIGGILTIDSSERFLDRFYYKPCVNNVFKNNIFKSNRNGIVIFSSKNNQFLNNYFNCKGGYGLILSSCTNNIIKNNEFIDDGLEIWGDERAHYIHEIKGNKVNGKPLYYFKDKYNFMVPRDAGQIIIVNCNQIIIEKTKISKTTTAVLIAFSINVIVRENVFSSNIRGVYLFYSTFCSIIKNNFIKNSIHAYFISYGFLNSKKNFWIGNYWDDWLGTKSLLFVLTNKRITGRFHLRPPFEFLDFLSIGFRTRNIDRIPARKPFNL